MVSFISTFNYILLGLTHPFFQPLFSSTPMKAAEEGHSEIVQLLLDYGANIKSINSKGRDALSFAAAPSMQRKNTEGHYNVVRLLVNRGTDLLHKDHYDRTAIDHARRENRNNMVKCLQELEKEIE